jgi:isopentenyldiphosphate isomerase
MNENLTIFSEDGNVLGSKTRIEIHTKPLQYWHGVTQIWVFNKDKKLLCSKRSSTVEGNPNKWQTYVGGHLKYGDSYEETAIKEVNEEIGLTITNERLILVGEYKNEQSKHISRAYLLIFNSSIDNITFNDGEISEIKWLSLDEYNLSIRQSPDEWCNTLNQITQELLIKMQL